MKLEPTSSRKVCILGTLHEYQVDVFRTCYLTTVQELMTLHKVDLIAEEAAGLSSTYAKRWVEECKAKLKLKIEWANVDLNGEERKGIPDVNPLGIGTLVDLDFNMTRELAWVDRTSKAMKDSALLICGWVHTFSVAEKFRLNGFAVETHVLFDRADRARIINAKV